MDNNYSTEQIQEIIKNDFTDSLTTSFLAPCNYLDRTANSSDEYHPWRKLRNPAYEKYRKLRGIVDQLLHDDPMLYRDVSRNFADDLANEWVSRDVVTKIIARCLLEDGSYVEHNERVEMLYRINNCKRLKHCIEE